MEDGLVHISDNLCGWLLIVLIIDVMENGLVHGSKCRRAKRAESLNPCCSERWSRTELKVMFPLRLVSLNPYFSGRWSRTYSVNYSETWISFES